MQISGLEELNIEEIANLDLDSLQDLLMMLYDLEPVKALGNKLHIGNIQIGEKLSFELDNGKELIDVHVIDLNSIYSITIYVPSKDGRALHYLYNKKRRVAVTENVFLNRGNLILKYHTKEEYSFELYDYDNASSIKIAFKAKEFDVDSFINKFFVQNNHVEELIKELPKKYLKVQEINGNVARERIYRDNKLVSDEKGEYHGEEREERQNKF